MINSQYKFLILSIESCVFPLDVAHMPGPLQNIYNGLTRFRFNFSLFPCSDFLHCERTLHCTE